MYNSFDMLFKDFHLLISSLTCGIKHPQALPPVFALQCVTGKADKTKTTAIVCVDDIRPPKKT